MFIHYKLLRHARNMALVTGCDYIVATVDDDSETNGWRFIVARSDYATTQEFEAFFGAVELTVHPDGTTE